MGQTAHTLGIEWMVLAIGFGDDRKPVDSWRYISLGPGGGHY